MVTKSVVREANVQDVEILRGLIDEVQDPHIASRPETFKRLNAAEVTEWLGALFENPSVKLWIAEVDAAAQGYLIAIIRDQLEGPFTVTRRWLEIDQIGVRGVFRRNGIARALVERAHAHAAASGVSAIELTSWSFNQAAHKAFQRLGFEPKVVRFELK